MILMMFGINCKLGYKLSVWLSYLALTHSLSFDCYLPHSVSAAASSSSKKDNLFYNVTSACKTTIDGKECWCPKKLVAHLKILKKMMYPFHDLLKRLERDIKKGDGLEGDGLEMAILACVKSHQTSCWALTMACNMITEDDENENALVLK